VSLHASERSSGNADTLSWQKGIWQVRHVFIRGVLIVLATCASLAAAEISLRLAARLTFQERGQVFDPDLGWRPASNVRKRGAYWGSREPAWTNARGWRDADTPLARTSGTSRIVVLGDSFVFGVSVDYGDRFTEVLESRMAGVQVVNLGVNAYGTDQELRTLEIEGVRYQPDLVILTSFLGNDLDDIRYERRFYWPRPHYELDGDELRLIPPESSWDVELRTASYVGELALRALDRVRAPDRPVPTWQSADTVPLYLALVRRIDQVAREHGATCLVVVTGRPPRPADRARVLSGLARAAIPAIDVDEALTHAMHQGARVFAADGHWNPEGHRIVAEQIIEAIRTHRWLPE
jgi:hypothetical protein